MPSAALSLTELKYRLLDRFGSIFYCDPDLYPIARSLDAQEIARRVSEIEKNTEEYQAILRRTGLMGHTTLSEEQQLLIYNEHKKLDAIDLAPSGGNYTFSLRTSDDAGRASAIEGVIELDGGITVSKDEPTTTTCPICLAGTTLIDTPSGPVSVKDLRAGMPIWTADAAGARRRAVVVATVRRPIPASLPLRRIVLEDGRALLVSLAHPTADGRAISDFAVGDLLDGAHVVTVERVLAQEAATYDILPSGASGSYWANGIRLKSTLHLPAVSESRKDMR